MIEFTREDELLDRMDHLLIECHSLRVVIALNEQALRSVESAIEYLHNELMLNNLVLFCQTGKYPA